MAQKLPWAFLWRTGSTRGHVTVLPLRFSTGGATPEQSGGGRLVSVATADIVPAGATRIFQNFLCSLFLFAIPAKRKKRDISFENECWMMGNAMICLLF